MKTIFKGIVGSQAQGLSTETSDTDYKEIYIQSTDDILSNRYIDNIRIDKDHEAYELRKFLLLLQKGNPNALELLFLPKKFQVIISPEWELLRSVRHKFLTKECYNTFVGYANSQLKKATALNKMSRWEKSNKDLEEYLSEPCEIDEALCLYIGECVPPIYVHFENGLKQGGDCIKNEYSQDGDLIEYYMTTLMENGRYFYLGILPEFKR